MLPNYVRKLPDWDKYYARIIQQPDYDSTELFNWISMNLFVDIFVAFKLFRQITKRT